MDFYRAMQDYVMNIKLLNEMILKETLQLTLTQTANVSESFLF